MKKYIISFSGAVDIEAENENEARKKFFDLSDEEIGQAIEEYDEIQEQEYDRSDGTSSAL